MRAILLIICVAACSSKSGAGALPPITEKWTDDFERALPGADYSATADVYRISGGVLNVGPSYNHPLWLRRPIPRDATIEFDCWSNSDAGDIKVELWGDGETHAKNKGAYTSSGYVLVMGGWGNSKSILAKGNEHGKELVERAAPKVERGRHYHWKVVRKGSRIDWYVDDMATPFLSLDDPQPLEGAGHVHFAFSNWEADLWFDNLTITPL